MVRTSYKKHIENPERPHNTKSAENGKTVGLFQNPHISNKTPKNMFYLCNAKRPAFVPTPKHTIQRILQAGV